VPRVSSARDARFGVVALASGYGVNWVELDPDDEQPSAEIALRPERLIHGQLLDLQGQAAAGVEVVLASLALPTMGVRLARREDPGHLLFGPARAKKLGAWPQPVTSDSEGRFTLRGVGSDLQATLIIRDRRYSQERILLKADGGSGPQRLTLSLHPARTLTGEVTFADLNLASSGARVFFNTFSTRLTFHPLVEEFTTDAEGRFRAHVESGEETVAYAQPPAGQPYLNVRRRLRWTPGATAHNLDLPLSRGVMIRGKVTEEASGQPVADAAVSFAPQPPLPGANATEKPISTPTLGLTRSDGSFEIVVPPVPGRLTVLGPSDEFVLREIEGETNPRRRGYAHANVPVDPKFDQPSPEIRLTLRRGITVKGRVIDSAGRPVPAATMISNYLRNDLFGAPLHRVWDARHPGRVQHGQFRLFGVDPGAEFPLSFLEPERKLGTTVIVSGKSAAQGPLTVQLQPCGTAQARLIGGDKKSVVRFGHHGLITLVVTPHSPPSLLEEEDLKIIDPKNYEDPTVSDGQGRISLPVLIPGATYRIYDYTTAGPDRPPEVRKEFVVRAGEARDLGDILIGKPRP
jgi:hypothetical protein